MNTFNPVQYSTYARTVMSESAVLARLIRKNAGIQETTSRTGFIPHPLTLEQIEEALINPQSAIKPSISAYATVIKIRRESANILERNKTQRTLLQDGVVKLRQKMTTAATESLKDELRESIIRMEKSNKDLLQISKKVKALETKLEQFEAQIIALIQRYDEEWDQYREYYLTTLVQELKDAGIILSELETSQLLKKETWSELIANFQHINLEIPQALNIEKPKFSTFFKLKAYLAIYACLSRNMQANTSKDILKLLKKLPQIN